MKTLILALVALTLALAAAQVRAENGRIEINQASALAGGVTLGDSPGFPVTISAPGSYVLTSNLVVAGSSDGIHVPVNGVTIDLNGFELAGPVVCAGLGSAVSCGAGTGVGINAADNATVRDGTVRGFGSGGVFLGAQAQVRRLVVESNGGTGINARSGSMISESIAFRNGAIGTSFPFGTGSLAGGGYVIEKSVASSNRASGFASDSGGSLVGCVAYDNGDLGFGAFGGTVIRDSSAYLNERHGMDGNGVVSDSAAYENGGNGIVGVSGTVQRNSIAGNAGYGLMIFVGDTTSYRENTITGNGDGTVWSGSGVDMGANSCNGATTCP